MEFLIEAIPIKPNNAIRVKPLAIEIEARPMRVLDFDIENRPLSYLGSDFTTAEVTAIAWAWADAPELVTVHLLGEEPLDFILRTFLKVYEQADLVTGHYIRGHDLPMVNGGLVECGMPVLGDKLTCDTKIDFVDRKSVV